MLSTVSTKGGKDQEPMMMMIIYRVNGSNEDVSGRMSGYKEWGTDA